MSGSSPISHNVVSSVVRITDLLVILLCGTLAHYLYLYQPDTQLGLTVQLGVYAYVIGIGAMLAAYVFHFADIYRFENLSRFFYQLGRLTTAWALIFFFLVSLAFLAKASASFSRVWTVLWFMLSFVGFVSIRVVVKVMVKRWVRDGRLTSSVVVVGAGKNGARFIKYLNGLQPSGVRVLGVFDDRATRVPGEIEGCRVLGNSDDLLRFARTRRIDVVFVALPWAAEERSLEILNKLRTLPVDIRLTPDMIGFALPYRQTSHIGGLPLLDVFDKPLTDWDLVIKDVEDQFLAVAISLFVLPLFVAVAALIKLDSQGPALFRQKRYGFNNQVIEVLKFRTMYHDSNPDLSLPQAKHHDPRVTRVGAFLRRSSLDELPQLWNVLRGEMSLVGPRPHAVVHNERYAKIINEYLSRHRVKPGITGWAQVNGLRGETDTVAKMQKRVEHDLYYIENWSLWFDLRILLLTLIKGFINKHAY